MNNRLSEHEHCIAITRNAAGEIIKCLTCDAVRTGLLDLGLDSKDTPAWNKLDNSLNPTVEPSQPVIDTFSEDSMIEEHILEDAVRRDNSDAINDSAREHTQESERARLPWKTKKYRWGEDHE